MLLSQDVLPKCVIWQILVGNCWSSAAVATTTSTTRRTQRTTTTKTTTTTHNTQQTTNKNNKNKIGVISREHVTMPCLTRRQEPKHDDRVEVFECNHVCHYEKLSSWWFQPISKYARQIGNHFSKDRGKNKKSLSCHHPVIMCWSYKYIRSGAATSVLQYAFSAL